MGLIISTLYHLALFASLLYFIQNAVIFYFATESLLFKGFLCLSVKRFQLHSFTSFRPFHISPSHTVLSFSCRDNSLYLHLTFFPTVTLAIVNTHFTQTAINIICPHVEGLM